MPERTGFADRLAAKLLATPKLMRLPIGAYRCGFGWIFGSRLVMIEHLGRVSHEPRYVVVEVVERGHNLIRVASGFGTKAQWYRNLRANGVAFLSTGRARRVPASVRMLDADESAERLKVYAAEHPEAWKHLSAAMDHAAGGAADIRLVEFTPPGSPASQARTSARS
ncbi:nitroreductase family deazaflavin-dependent oxidoreductase [Microbacterium alcoholitolerans]|uniref:nitroreductase family deazaflavin-dependent oxidoreductase n=1 Tax=unclassified Microbacterium TaxID=2609290 RepID=UPI003D1770E3